MKPQDTPQQQPQDQSDYTQPVAYDAEGRPLYAHPPVVSTPSQPQTVQMVRPLEPAKQEMSEESKARHEASVAQFPTLNLSEGEYVVRAVRRHPIGLFAPMLLGTFLIAGALSLWLNFDMIAEGLMLAEGTGAGSVALPVLLFCLLVGLGMYVFYYIYTNNKFFLTNEAVIQEIQHSLFSRHEQTVSLNNIEDASYVQSNIIQHLLNYGSIRLSTEGDETTYHFTYVTNPKEHIAKLNNAVEAFKLGRPVDAADS